MSRRNINIPQHLNCEVVGYLYDSDNYADLGQTMVEVTTPEGVAINCGWVPEGDPAGSYQIDVTQGLRCLRRPINFSNIEAAAREIEKLTVSLCLGEPKTDAASGTCSVTVSVDYSPSDFEATTQTHSGVDRVECETDEYQLA